MNREKNRPSHLATSLTAKVQQTVRAEGHGVPILELKRTKTHDGESVMVGIDIGAAPVPTRRYVAETCSVVVKDTDVCLIFGQRGLLSGEVLDSALIVRFAPHAARRFSDSLFEIANPSLEEIAERVQIKPMPLTEISVEPRQLANVVANFGSVAISGWESCIDFYYASPFAMRNIERRGMQELELEPVVRVDIKTPLFMSLKKRLSELVPELPNQGEL